MSNGGRRANSRGRILERSIDGLLGEEYEKVPPKEFDAARKSKKPIYAKQYTIGENIYGKKRRVDFILYHPQRWPKCLVIECKWQTSPGSVEEKYPFEVLSINNNKLQTIVVLDGKGYTKGAEKWLKDQAGKGKLLHVFSQIEIIKFQRQGKL